MTGPDLQSKSFDFQARRFSAIIQTVGATRIGLVWAPACSETKVEHQFTALPDTENPPTEGRPRYPRAASDHREGILVPSTRHKRLGQ